MLLPPLTSELLSSLLGYASIGCWIIAQAPQILENYTQQSCDGLALPFLLNWLCGDITNVIGCLLTDQKEFQTLLATYFCIVDLLLAGQYAYYTRLRAQRQHKEATRQHHARHGSSSGIDYESVVGVGGSNGNGSAILASNPASPTIHPGSISGERSPLVRAPSIHSAALDVARAVEKIEQRRRSQSARRKVDKYARSNSNSEHQQLMYQHQQQKQDRSPSVTSPLWSATAESTTKSNSYLSAPDRESRRGRPRGRLDDSSSAAISGPPPILDLDRDPEIGRRSISTSPRNTTKHKRPSGISSSPSTLKSTTSTTGGGQRQRAAGVVFMSVFLMVGVGRTAGWGRDGSAVGKGGAREPKGGEVLVPYMEARWQSSSVIQDVATDPHLPSPALSSLSKTQAQRRMETLHFPGSSEAESGTPLSGASSSSTLRIFTDKREPPPNSNSGNSNSHYQRVIGRASAWICTTLYLTSRLPQIWKNYTRKSVEGLSILLFVFAFMGNATYVGSIMLNPGGGEEHGGGASEEERAYYLLEALPYLLGSGGTLIFDLTIMCQAVFYGSAKPIEPPATAHHLHHHHHSNSHSHHHRSRSRSSYRPGPASGTGSGPEPPHLRRIGSESRSFTSLGAVDEESHLLLDNGGEPYHDYGGPGNDLTPTPRASHFDASSVSGNDREEEGKGKMKG
ncbi:hypothetical protein QFC21_004954 [Naganishia friedmannii]|uniref:Uncharacterized protein n=1 Tax=Naganishia friedmannii TaxID=89922 RepID=A0ACC2VD20_9TREE|nr:hypothetical protein QFC21_004954 [Naganishia friedmannii]